LSYRLTLGPYSTYRCSRARLRDPIAQSRKRKKVDDAARWNFCLSGRRQSKLDELQLPWMMGVGA
jgi:hypothetical protein